MKHRVVCILILALFLCSCSESTAGQEYMPLVWDSREGIVEDAGLLTKEHVDRVEHVLQFYDVEFHRVSETQLLIMTPIDKDTLWNFTTKAEDDVWLKDHPI